MVSLVASSDEDCSLSGWFSVLPPLSVAMGSKVGVGAVGFNLDVAGMRIPATPLLSTSFLSRLILRLLPGSFLRV